MKEVRKYSFKVRLDGNHDSAFSTAERIEKRIENTAAARGEVREEGRGELFSGPILVHVKNPTSQLCINSKIL